VDGSCSCYQRQDARISSLFTLPIDMHFSIYSVYDKFTIRRLGIAFSPTTHPSVLTQVGNTTEISLLLILLRKDFNNYLCSYTRSKTRPVLWLPTNISSGALQVIVCRVFLDLLDKLRRRLICLLFSIRIRRFGTDQSWLDSREVVGVRGAFRSGYHGVESK